jgi:hypothetical protein
MIELKTSELVGVALDWAVAKSEGHQPLLMPIGRVEYAIGVTVVDSSGKASGFACRYSSEWAQGGPLIERHEITVRPVDGKWWAAHVNDSSTSPCSYGLDPLIAACRAIVAAKLGDVVSVPSQLLEPMQ